MYMSQLLDPDRIITNYIYIAKHIFDNLDDYWPFSYTVHGSFYQIGRIFTRP